MCHISRGKGIMGMFQGHAMELSRPRPRFEIQPSHYYLTYLCLGLLICKNGNNNSNSLIGLWSASNEIAYVKCLKEYVGHIQ